MGAPGTERPKPADPLRSRYGRSGYKRDSTLPDESTCESSGRYCRKTDERENGVQPYLIKSAK